MAVAVLWYVLATTLVACFAGFLCFVAYLHYLHKINDHLPGPPRSSFILGHLPDLWKYKSATGRTLGEFLLEKRLEYGPIFVLFFANIPIVFLGDSSYVREVFIKNHNNLHKSDFLYRKLGFVYGERSGGYGIETNTNEVTWRKQRQVMNPAFHRKYFKDCMSKFNDVSHRFLDRMNTIVDSGKPTSMVQEFGKFTMESISQVLFNINTHAIEDPDSPFPAAIRNCFKGVQDNMDNPLSPTLLTIFQFKLFQNATKKKQIDATRFLRKFASECITTRMKDIADDKAGPEDLFSFLIKDGSFSLDQISDEFLTIFMGGQDATANSLAFTLYEIIRNPHVEEKLLNEVDEVLGKRDYVEFDDLAKLKYLGHVLDESLRKHPVAPPLPSRLTAKEITVGGYHIPKGDGVVAYTLFFGMNPEIWKDPEIFYPERFSDTANIPNFGMTHFPFSIGPHTCIGMNFARVESKVLLARLLRMFQFKLLPGQTDRMEERLGMTPRDGVMCESTRRE